MTTPDKQVRLFTKQDFNGGRIYVHPVTGEEFRSVTTILSAAAKPALDKWKTKTIARFAAENRVMLAEMDEDAAFDLVRSSQYTSSGVAAATGEAVHSRLELLFGVLKAFQENTDAIERDDRRYMLAWMMDNGVPVQDPLMHVDKCFLDLLEEFEIRPLHMEATIINREIGYAGSGDLIAMIRPRTDLLELQATGQTPPAWKRAVIDAKSGKSIYGSVALQLVGYAKAEVILLEDGSEVPMPVIHETYALHVRPRSWALRPMRYDLEVWEAFKHLVGTDRWVNAMERGAVGDPINRGAISRMRGYNSTIRQAAA